MLFRLSKKTPRFEVFRLLNNELLYFLEQSITKNSFNRKLFSSTAVGQACFNNSKGLSRTNELTCEKFKNLHSALQKEPKKTRQTLFETYRENQNLDNFFRNPNPDLLSFLPKTCFNKLSLLSTHLYCATKDLSKIISAAGGKNINDHFEAFRAIGINGNICSACGMEQLATFRASVPGGQQWRADYDHQLCKSKYPIFSVHPDNLIPLCDVCNQDAKKAKDLFRCDNGNERFAFYPYTEEARNLIQIELDMLRDPEPIIKVVWTTLDVNLLNKLNTWDEIYDICRRVEGQFRSIEIIIEDEINPIDLAHLRYQVNDKARPVSEITLKRKAWSFWNQKFFEKLNQNFEASAAPFWEKSQFISQQAADGGDYILEGP